MVFPTIFVLFIAMPILEIFALIQVGGAIGALPTIAIVILTAIVGTWLLAAMLCKSSSPASHAGYRHFLR